MNPRLRSFIDSQASRLESSRIGRILLGALARLAAGVITRRSIGFRRVGECWFRLDGGAALPIGNRLILHRGVMSSWEAGGEDISRLRRGWWFRHYRPLPGDLVIDVGAGRGEDTAVFSTAVGPTGTVISVEAHPSTFAVLEDFVRLNKLPNVRLEHCAACDSSGTCFITEESEELWQCASLKRSNGIGMAVPAKRIDDLPEVSEAKTIAFLKMNIEGAEVDALHGALETLSKTETVCVCCHDFLGEQTQTKAAVQRILQGQGFRLFFSPPDSPPYEGDFVYGVR